jgi:hypothetical protein
MIQICIVCIGFTYANNYIGETYANLFAVTEF